LNQTFFQFQLNKAGYFSAAVRQKSPTNEGCDDPDDDAPLDEDPPDHVRENRWNGR